MLFDLDLIFARPKNMMNPFKYYPDAYLQDSSKSLLTADSRRYDLKRFSAHEVSVVKSVLSAVSEKYPEKFQSIGLANESYVITYKPRYVLFEIIIIKYQNSCMPLDRFSVAYAYAMKGAQFRRKAIDYFEKSIDKIHFSTLDKFASVNSSFVYMKFAELYEKEWEFEKTVYWLKKAMKRGGISKKYLREKINEIGKKRRRAERGDTKRRGPRKASEKDIEFENDVRNAALQFIQEAI